MKKILFLFISIAILFSCDKKNDSDLYSYDDPYGKQGLTLIDKVSGQCADYIESYLQQYFSQNTNADIKDLVYKINHIDGVDEASPNDNSSAIRIKLKSGAYINYLIFRRDDDRLSTIENKTQSQQFLSATNTSNSINLRSTSSDYNTPTVKKALILAPFQSVFNDNIFGLYMYLGKAGYDVTPPIINQDATIDYFRGDYLKQFGVIYIATHGSYELYPLSGESNKMSFLLTSTKLSDINISSYNVDDRKNLALLYLGDEQYLAVSEKWISKNLNPLPNTLVYIDACYSAINDQLPDIFKNNGAGAYVGWNGIAPTNLASFTSTIFDYLSSGIEFDAVYSSHDWSPWLAEDGRYYGYAYYKKQSNIPYYLIKKEEESGDWVLINGVKWATRNVGAPGTFVANPEDYGGYYQWNRGTTDFLSWEDYCKSKYANAISWQPVNDPSPSGYRVPTEWEFWALTVSTSHKWVTQNGVYGELFSDQNSGASIFLPAAGGYQPYMWNGGIYLNTSLTLNNAGASCYYWCADDRVSYITDPWVIYFDGSEFSMFPATAGYSVRCVKE